MTISILRLDHDAGSLRWHASLSRSGALARRLLALALVLDGADRESAAHQAGMTRQTLRDWVHRYNAAGLAGLADRAHGGGARPRLSAAQAETVAGWVEAGPDLVKDGVVRWRRVDLQVAIAREFAVTLHERTVGKLLHRLGFRHVSARPRHPKADPAAQEAHKKDFAALIAAAIPDHARGKPIELWWEDEARVGQKGSLTYLWALKGSRPAVLRDLRYESAYIFGAVCPGRDIGVGLVMPAANAEAMNLHLAEISKHVRPGAHAVITLDGASWHQSGGRLCVPGNISLLPLPPYSPELNPVENIWQYLRQNYLANRVFDTYDAIVDACCEAWNALCRTPGKIQSIATRKWAESVSQ